MIKKDDDVIQKFLCEMSKWAATYWSRTLQGWRRVPRFPTSFRTRKVLTLIQTRRQLSTPESTSLPPLYQAPYVSQFSGSLRYLRKGRAWF